jgi:hypothetical protein
MHYMFLHKESLHVNLEKQNQHASRFERNVQTGHMTLLLWEIVAHHSPPLLHYPVRWAIKDGVPGNTVDETSTQDQSHATDDTNSLLSLNTANTSPPTVLSALHVCIKTQPSKKYSSSRKGHHTCLN